MTVHFGYPLAIALAISTLVSGAITGTSVLDGAKLDEAVTQGGRWFLILLASLGSLLLLALFVWFVVLPLMLAKIQNPRAQPRQRKQRTRVVAINSKGSRPHDTIGDKMARAFERIGQGANSLGHQLERIPPPRRRNQGSFAQTTRPLTAKVEHIESETSLLEEVYRVTHYMYHRGLTRPDFELAFPGENGQAIYAKYKDIWDRLGWIELDGKKAIKQWLYEEHQLYASDRKLRQIATELGFQWPTVTENGEAS